MFKVSRNRLFKARELLIAFAWGALPLVGLAQSSQSQLLPEQRSTATRVVIVQNSEATDAFEPRLELVRPMIEHGLTALTGKSTVASAWLSLISTQDIVGLKVYCGPGAASGTRPAVVAAVIESLLKAHIATNHIIVWDKRLVDLKNSGFDELAAHYGVLMEACSAVPYDSKVFYENSLLGKLMWGDSQFGNESETVARKSFVSTLLTKRITKIVNITPLLNHHTGGVCGNLFSLATGSVDNVVRFETAYSRLATTVPEIYALPALGDHVALNIVDALICQYQGEQTTLLHYASILNQIRFSKDPVALDVLSIQELDKQRRAAGISLAHTNSMELFENASLLELGTSDPQNIRVEMVR